MVVGGVSACSILVDTTGLVGNPPSDGGGGADVVASDAPTDGPSTPVDGAVDASEGGAATVIALDEFAREVTDGLGSADVGGAWSNKPGTKAVATITGGAARIGMLAGGGYHTILAGARARDTELRTDFKLDKTPTGSGAYLALTTRAVSEATSYHATLVVRESGQTTARLSTVSDFDETRMIGEKTTNIPLGSTYHLRFRATGSMPTTLRLKVWRDEDPEPAAWTTEGTDDTAQLQVAGASGLDFYLSSSATIVPVLCTVERFEVRASD